MAVTLPRSSNTITSIGSTRILWSPAVRVKPELECRLTAGDPQRDQLALALHRGDRRIETADRDTTDVHLAADRIFEGGVVGIEAGKIVGAAANKRCDVAVDRVGDRLGLVVGILHRTQR